jgi:hypothetical protein
MLRSLATVAAVAAAVAFCLSACAEEKGMKQSVTYLHLLRHTPFFTALSKEQLQYVIAHSTEWEARAGQEISNGAEASDFMWVLLDGGWQVEQAGRVSASGHSSPGKWYGGVPSAMPPADSRLVANQHSYVMRIARRDLEQMLADGFDFGSHLQQGAGFYAGLNALTSQPKD